MEGTAHTFAIFSWLEVLSHRLAHTQGEGLMQGYEYQKVGIMGLTLESTLHTSLTHLHGLIKLNMLKMNCWKRKRKK